MLTKLTAVIILLYITNNYVVYLKLIYSYISIVSQIKNNWEEYPQGKGDVGIAVNFAKRPVITRRKFYFACRSEDGH